MTNPAVSDLILSLGASVAAGLVGSIAVMRRMSLASDAFSHVALPGIALALLFRVNPVLGGLIALVVGALLIWSVGQRARVPTEAIVGVLFSAALAAGSMLASGEELIEALFGAQRSAGSAEIALGTVGALAVIVFVVRAESRLVLTLVSPDLARTAGVRPARLELLYLLAFAVTVALGLRFLGVLLMGSMVIIPAATAKNLARNLVQMRTIAVGVSVLATLTGALLAPRLGLERGAVTVIVAAVVFAATIPFSGGK